MRPLEKTISILVLFAGLIFFGSADAQDLSPQDSVKKLLDTIAKIKIGGNISAEQKDSNQKHSDQAIVFLDLKMSGVKPSASIGKTARPKNRRILSPS